MFIHSITVLLEVSTRALIVTNDEFAILSRHIFDKLRNGDISFFRLRIEQQMLRFGQSFPSLNRAVRPERRCRERQNKASYDNQTGEDNLVEQGLLVASVVVEAAHDHCNQHITETCIQLLLIIFQVEIWLLVG